MSVRKFSFGPTGCEWVIGLAENARYSFCGSEVSSHRGSCYCEKHREMAYVKPSDEDIKKEETELAIILQEEGSFVEFFE